MSDTFKKSVAAGFLLCLAFYLRIETLGNRYMEVDETFSLYAALQTDWRTLFAVIKNMGPIQHGLDFAVDHLLWPLLPGIFELRLIKVFWGLLTVCVVFALGSHLKDRATGLIAAFLLAISPFHIEYSQMIRFYALIGLLSAATLWCFFKSREAAGWLLGFAISMALYQAVYPFALAAGLACLLAVWIYDREKLRLYIAALLPSWLGLLVWGLTLGRGIASSPFSYELGSIISPQVFQLAFLRFGHDRFWTATLLFLFFGAGVFFHGRKVSERFQRTALLLSAAFIFMGLFISLLWVRVHFKDRYLISLLPIFVLFAAIGLREAMGRLPRLARIPLMVIVLGTLLVASRQAQAGQQRIRSHWHNVFVQASMTLREKARDGDVVVFSDPNTGASFITYLDFPAFKALLPPRIGRSRLIFQFPPELATSGEKRFALYTICDWAPGFATFEARDWARLRKEKPGSAVWFVYMGSDFKERNPFLKSLGVPVEAYHSVVPGLFQLRILPS